MNMRGNNERESGRRLAEAKRQVGFIAQRMGVGDMRQQRATDILSLAETKGILGSRRPAILAAAALGIVEGVKGYACPSEEPKLETISRHAGNLDIKELASELITLRSMVRIH